MTANPRAFRVLVRNALFRRVELAALRRGTRAGRARRRGAAGTPTRWAEAVEAYFDEHDDLGTGPDARGPQYFVLDEHPRACRRDRLWRVRQIFDDPDGDHDWGIGAEVDLAASDEAGEAVVRVVRRVGALQR